MRQSSAARFPVPLQGPDGDAGPLTVSVSAREGYTLVRLDGEADVTVRDRLLAAFTAPVAAGTPHLVVDLSGLAYLDCSCVQVLWRASRMATEAGGMLGLAAPRPPVARVLELWGAGQVIGVHDSVAALDGLLLRVARGDAEAFAGVYDQVASAVYGLVLRIAGDQSRAEQVTAEILLEVWRSASRFSPAEDSGLSWVMTMARRRAIGHAGAAGDGRTAGLRPYGAAGVIAERAAGSLLEHRGLASLPGPQREAVLLASCGYTWRQAADLAGVPAGTVAGRLREGLLGLSSRPQ